MVMIMLLVMVVVLVVIRFRGRPDRTQFGCVNHCTVMSGVLDGHGHELRLI